MIDVPLGIYFMFRPLKKIKQFGHLLTVRWIFTFIWIAAITSFLPVHGILIYPIGNAVDGVLSALCVSILYKKNKLSEKLNFRLRAVEGLATLSIGIIIMWFTLDILHWQNNFGLVFSGILATTLSIIFFKMFSGIKQVAIPSKDEMKDLYGELALTPTETAICYLVHKGITRPIIAETMGIKPVTLKKHLQTIYAKVFKKSKIEQANGDKYFQLYLWLEKKHQEKKENPHNSSI
jgi:hypothetical protein